MPRGCRQDSCVKRPIRSPNAKTYVSSDSVLCEGKWETIPLQPGRAKLNGIRKTITSRIWIESTECRRSPSGKYSQESQRWLSREDSKSHDRLTVWSGELQRQDHLHVNVQRHCMGRTRKQRTKKQFTDSCGICSQIPSRSRKEMVRNFHRQTRRIMGSNGTRNDGKFLSIRSSDISCLQYLSERRTTKQGRLKEVYTLQWYSWKQSSCFSAQWILRISSVSTEQSQIYVTKYPSVSGLGRNLQHLSIWKIQCKAVGKSTARIEQFLMWVLKLVEREQYFYTLDTDERQQMPHLCREYTMSRNEKETGMRGWIVKNTRIKVCYHDGRYSIEVQIPSLFEDNTVLLG